jgi:hypothetical protein
MRDDIMNETIESQKNQSRSSLAIDLGAFAPRLWMVMAALYVPFFISSFNYFEMLERTGYIGAYIADTFLPITNIAYIAAMFSLKSRKM